MVGTGTGVSLNPCATVIDVPPPPPPPTINQCMGVVGTAAAISAIIIMIGVTRGVILQLVPLCCTHQLDSMPH